MRIEGEKLLESASLIVGAGLGITLGSYISNQFEGKGINTMANPDSWCNLPAQKLPESFEAQNIIRDSNELSNETFNQLKERFLALNKRKAIYVMSRTPGLKDVEVCPQGQNGFTIWGRYFNTDNPSDFILANTFIDGLFYEKYNRHPAKTFRDKNTLVWLKDNIEVKTGNNTPPILPLPELETVARVLMALGERGFRIPREIQIDDQDIPYDNTILHLKYDRRQLSMRPDIYLPKFLINTSGLLESYRRVDQNMTEEKALDFINDYVFWGDILRARVLYENLYGNAKGSNRLNTLYRLTQKSLMVEFAGENKAFPKKRTSSDFRPGMTIKIDDYERPDRPGIYLRSKDLVPIPGSAVFDGDEVDIIDGPFYHTKVTREAGYTRAYYRVRKVIVTKMPSGQEVFWLQEGKIDSEYMGQIVKAP